MDIPQELIQHLPPEIADPEEGAYPSRVSQLVIDEYHLGQEKEIFDLFSHSFPSEGLGFVDPKSHLLEISVAGRDLAIHQSPTVLSSNRAGGTTGADSQSPASAPSPARQLVPPESPLMRRGKLAYKSMPSWWQLVSLAEPSINQDTPRQFNLITSSTTILELGCGVNTIIGLVLARSISTYILTDQPYVAKYVAQNLAENAAAITTTTTTASNSLRNPPKGRKSRTGRVDNNPARVGHVVTSDNPALGNITFRPLDWETDAVTSSLTGSNTCRSFDLVIACDCVYNEALVGPLVQTCADVCALRMAESIENPPTCCVVAQQLRDYEVFDTWLIAFQTLFRVWRIPDSDLPKPLGSGSGYVVHIGFLRRPQDRRE